MKEKAKLKLEDIKVESFITALDENAVNKLIGATDDGDLCGIPDTQPATCTCPTLVAASCGGTCDLTGEQCVHC
jgi:hypothetical protein